MQKKKAKTNVVTSPPIFYTPFLPHGVYIISFIHSFVYSVIHSSSHSYSSYKVLKGGELRV